MRRLTFVRAMALGSSLGALSACFSYVAAPPSGARVGERVRIRVSGAQAERLEPVLGMTDRNIEGDLLEQLDSSITLGVPLPAVSASGIPAARPQQRIVVPRADVQEVELRRLDKLRTSLLIGGAVAGVAAIAVAKGSSLLGGSGATGSPNESRLPRGTPFVMWRIPVP